MITIAHRLRTIRQMDQILFLQDGKVADSGTHDELLNKNKQYVNLIECEVLQSLNGDAA